MKYVMMVPLRRCGSNAIRLRMNLHPEFYSPYPLHLCDVKKTYQVEDDLEYFQMVVDMVGLQRHSLVAWENVVLDPVDIFKTIRDKPRSIYQVYWEMLSRAGKQHHARVVMDKCQDSVCDFQELVQLFPHLLFLDVVRDPRAQVSSMNDAIIYDFDTQLNTTRWVQSRQWSEQIHQKHPDKILTIRYEDFILNQEDTLRTICRFMGLPFDPCVLEVQHSQEAHDMSLLSPLWETNYSHPIPHYMNKFQEKLTWAEIEHIESKTLEWMKKYHYTPMTPHQAPLPYSIHTAQERSRQKEETWWAHLQKKYPYDFILRKSRSRFLSMICAKKNL